MLAYLPPSLETPVLFIAPTLGIIAMLLFPLIAGEGEKHWSRRPLAVLMVAVIAVTLGVFTRLGTYTPWSPIMDAWTRDPIPVATCMAALRSRGRARLFCRTSNAATATLSGSRRASRAGARCGCGPHDGGPDHSPGAAGRRQYAGLRQALNPSETTALVRFLTTLQGNDLPPAIDASRHMALSANLRRCAGGALALEVTLISCLLRRKPSLPSGRLRLF